MQIFKKIYLDIVFFLLTPLSYPYSLVLKEIFQKKRPSGALVDPLFKSGIYSFPSTHTLVYTVVCGYLVYSMLKLPLNTFVKAFISILGVAILLYVGVSRVTLGVHWLSDVIAGYFFGGIFLAGLVLLNKRFVNYGQYMRTKN